MLYTSVAMPIEHPLEHQGNSLDKQGIDQSSLDEEGPKNQWTPQERKQYLDVAFSFIGNIGEHYKSAGIEDYFEGELKRAGLVERLEQAGILPSFAQNAEKRGETLRHLFIGATLGHVFGEELLSLIQHPASHRPWSLKNNPPIDPSSER